MSQIIFKSKEHRDFFLEMMSKCKVNDCYHRAFFYVMGIAGETRANINQMFDFKQDCIEPEVRYEIVGRGKIIAECLETAHRFQWTVHDARNSPTALLNFLLSYVPYCGLS